MSNEEWDASQGANPDTCLHMLGHIIPNGMFLCVSCNSTLDREYVREFIWDYDISAGIWKRKSIEESAKLLQENDKGQFEPFTVNERFHGPDVLGYMVDGRLYKPSEVIVYTTGGES